MIHSRMVNNSPVVSAKVNLQGVGLCCCILMNVQARFPDVVFVPSKPSRVCELTIGTSDLTHADSHSGSQWHHDVGL